MRGNRKAVEAEVTKTLSRRVEAAAINIEGAAKSLCPVDTTRLQSSITHAPFNGSGSDYSDGAVIGTDVPYGKFVELGTVDSAAQPFLVPALEATKGSTKFFLRGGK